MDYLLLIQQVSIEACGNDDLAALSNSKLYINDIVCEYELRVKYVNAVDGYRDVVVEVPHHCYYTILYLLSENWNIEHAYKIYSCMNCSAYTDWCDVVKNRKYHNI